MAKKFQVDTGGTLTTGLQAYYKMEDVTEFFGAIASIDLTNVGSVAFNAGKVSNAADTGASNSTKDLEVGNRLGITGGNMSFSFWVKPYGLPGSNAQTGLVSVIDGQTSHTEYTSWLWNDAGTQKLAFQRTKRGVGDSYNLKYTTTLSTSSWTHVVNTFDGTTATIYVNGTSAATTTTVDSNNGSSSESNEFSVFVPADGFATPYDWSSALIDEVGVWSKALSTQEVTDLYNSGSGQTMINSNVTRSPSGGAAYCSPLFY